MPATDAVLDQVASNPQSIAYVSAGNLREDVKPIRVEGVEPTIERIMEGTYPLSRPFLMVTRAEPQGEVRAFLDFVLSPPGQAIVAKRHVRIR
jgi:phosphate transport system substrate-binding protein